MVTSMRQTRDETSRFAWFRVSGLGVDSRLSSRLQNSLGGSATYLKYYLHIFVPLTLTNRLIMSLFEV